LLAVATTEPTTEGWSDEQIVVQVLSGSTYLFEIIVRRHTQRLYRVALGILGDWSEAEDVMQASYVRAYQHLSQFAGRARFATWLTRITVHEALGRLQQRKRVRSFDAVVESGGFKNELFISRLPDPEYQASFFELTNVLQNAVLSLPGKYRKVLLMRDLEERSTAETAAQLAITEETVKIRLHRARAMLRRQFDVRLRKNGHSRQPPFHKPRQLQASLAA
jgi:RNA polymerase sigma-70 factor (ECF subfamily)